MRHLIAIGLGIATLLLAACSSCSDGEGAEATSRSVDDPQGVPEIVEEDPILEAPDGQSLTFEVEGGRLDGKSFDVEVPDNLGYWLFDPKGKQTVIAARGEAHGLDAYLYTTLRRTEPGVYEFSPGKHGADTGVQIRFRDREAGTAFALVAVEGFMELKGPVDDYLLGELVGRFVYSERMGADLKDLPEEEREYAKVRNGEFAVSWKDRIKGKALRWEEANQPGAIEAALEEGEVNE